MFLLLLVLQTMFTDSSLQFMQLNGREGISGWRWIFIIEGVLTCALAIVCYWLLVDFPESDRKTWNFLSPQERQWAVSRIQADRGDHEVEPFNIRKFLKGGKDWRIWAYALICFDTLTVSYALAYTLPIILVGNMGFSVSEAQCLVAPPFVFAAIVMYMGGWIGDKYRVRGPIIIFNMLLCLIGLPIMGWHKNSAVRYFGVFLVAAGANSNVTANLSFQANNVRGQWKRAFCSATLVGLGGVGGIAGSLVFREQDKATGYKPGFYACIACCLLTVILVVACDVDAYRQNKLADEGKKVLESHSVSGPFNVDIACFSLLTLPRMRLLVTSAIHTRILNRRQVLLSSVRDTVQNHAWWKQSELSIASSWYPGAKFGAVLWHLRTD